MPKLMFSSKPDWARSFASGSQVFPFYDHTAIGLLGAFETEVYRAL